MTTEKATAIANEIFSLFEQFGEMDYIGEKVSQSEHALQAAQLAETEGYDSEIILAALLHDIGHLYAFIAPAEKMNEFGITDHETIGANYLRERGFSEKIARLVESHVAAKRYLTFKFPEYYNRLSDASKYTLEQQGGQMNETEAELFEQDHLHKFYIKLREWDDRAKVEHLPLPGIDHYKQLTIRHLVNN
jgi:2-amino-1-hydroxyethylphosphonate dioxygenase (glycine-forming)